ncbi:MAG: 2-C-methyl-D-erythritol 4-phosphate cytidylyltransferase [Clostridiales bacterium]|nr:2-C-methyl-D-erythritol 4-phosphate cytidylyltransferase [Clostridiales bacterium]
MRNIVVIFAGGVGTRMKNTDKPKQFLRIDGKPIIIHTLEKFETCTMIDAIAVACNKDYMDNLNELLIEFDIKKVKWVVPGGETGQLSIFNGLDVVYNDKNVCEDAVVLIHDGVRPVIDNQLILENIVTARTYGNAVTVVNATETIVVSKDKRNMDDLLERDVIYFAKAPQTFFLKEIHSVHLKEMESDSIKNVDSCSMMFKYGHKLNFVKGKSSNIKITTYEDYYIFKALYELEQKRKMDDMLT